MASVHNGCGSFKEITCRTQPHKRNWPGGHHGSLAATVAGGHHGSVAARVAGGPHVSIAAAVVGH